ncbi:MAG TPA: carboxypeptidase-like regulatory domain-containing protein, partial [Bryobacteraceae bacterium]|nr:carboxypeptidase-like regulatory domain-containing protein [Bryobacteraceae bacterium]
TGAGMIRAVAVLYMAALGSAAFSQDINGRVVEDHSGSPLASVGVRVQRTGAARLVADIETEADGRFSLPALPPGEYRFDLSKPNYIGATLRFRGAIPQTLMVRLVRCGVISGRISDYEGRPVRGAIVYAMPRPPSGGPLRPVEPQAQGGYSMVDQDGQYRLFYLPPGQYAVAVSYGASSMMLGSTGSAPVNRKIGSGVAVYPTSSQPQFFAIAGGEEYRNVDLILPAGPFYSVSGRVEVPAGGPQTGRFWLTLARAEQPSLATAATTADQDGKFRFEGIAPGSYNLLASGPSNARGSRGSILPPEPYFARSRVEVVAQDVEAMAVSPRKGQTAAFVMAGVKDSEGACPESAQLTLTALEDWAAVLERRTTVNSAKEEVLRDLAPARYRLALTNLGDRCYQTAAVTLDLGQGSGSEPVAIRVAPAGSIRGKLTGAASPTDYVVALLPADAGGEEPAVQVAFPDAEARFTFSSLRPGRYHLIAQPASASGSRWVSDTARMPVVEIAGGSATDLELPVPAAAEGRQP